MRVLDLAEFLATPEREPKGPRVRIKTKEKCPKCGKAFVEPPLGYLCLKRLTTPRRYYIYFSWKGRKIKIYSFRDGQPLSSFELAKRAQEIITHEIEAGTFDPSRWVRSDLEKFHVRYLVERYIANKAPEIKYSSLKKK